jgi:hypothetical protein
MTPGRIAFYLSTGRKRNTLPGLYLTESGALCAE